MARWSHCLEPLPGGRKHTRPTRRNVEAWLGYLEAALAAWNQSLEKRPQAWRVSLKTTHGLPGKMVMQTGQGEERSHAAYLANQKPGAAAWKRYWCPEL